MLAMVDIVRGLAVAEAFQLAGYRHVIGTLWAINDRTAVQIADTFYGAIADSRPGPEFDTGHAAIALHKAVRTIRDAFPKLPSLWASHIHAGA